MHANDDAIWKALGDSTRRSILDQLAQGPRTTGSLAESFPDLSRFAVMKHLGILEDAHLITWRKQGRERWNSINAVPLRQLYERWVSTLGDAQAASLTSLARLVEDTTKPTGDSAMTDTFQTFDVTSEIQIAAPVETVWTIMTTRMGDWAKEPFRAFKDGDPIEIDLRPGGAMVETSADGESCVWGWVTSLKPGEQVLLTGPCLMHEMGITGTFSFTVAPDGDGSKVTVHHMAIGVMWEGQGEGYRGGWDSLLGDLKTMVEAA